MFLQLNRKGWPKAIASFLLVNFLFDLFIPNITFANGGIGQTDLYGSPDGASQLVNPATGDFSYNIPLANLDGYPLNLTYNAGIRPDQEASWVGLGWSLSPGAVNRTMRGIPDEFNGEEMIEKEVSFEDNVIRKIGSSKGVEVVALDYGESYSSKFTLGVGFSLEKYLRTDNYKGPGIGYSVSPSISANASQSMPVPVIGKWSYLGANSSLSGTLGIDSQSGLSKGFTSSYGLSLTLTGDNHDGKISLSKSNSSSYNSLSGLTTTSSSINPSVGYGEWYNTASQSLGSYRRNSIIPSSTFAFTPRINIPSHTTVSSFKLKKGAEYKGNFAHKSLFGSKTQIKVDKSIRLEPAFGYFYSHKANDMIGVMDVNRENDGVITEANKSTPITNFTYDLFTASASGMALNFRSFRSDAGTVRDNYIQSTTSGSDASTEFGINFSDLVEVKTGSNVTNTMVRNSTGVWTEHNDLKKRLKFVSDQAIDYEDHYFKAAGDMGAIDASYLTSIGNYDPLGVGMVKTGNEIHHRTTGVLLRSVGDPSPVVVPTDGIYRTKREKRTNTISYLTAEERKSEDILSYNDFTYSASDGFSNYNAIDALAHSNNRKHHMSEIKVVTANGWRYDYGIPVYNREKTDYVFNVAGGNLSTGLAAYNPADDMSSNNSHGNKFFSRTKYPDYAEAFLLTAALSPDYSDVSQNGPTPDDLGNYTKFNYTLFDDDFNWRVPIEQNQARYNNGFNSDEVKDDKGTVVYGKKELWYLHSIETKNFVAEFHLKDRRDGFGVTNEHGGVNVNEKKQALDKIVVYTIAEKLKGTSAKPIREIFFEYTNELCEGIPDLSTSVTGIGSGKLTLKKVTIKDYESNTGEYAYYKFDYGMNHSSETQDYNPNHNLETKDRWGSYKPQTNGITNPYNSEFPYALQNNTNGTLDDYAKSWNLSTIHLPSGSRIEVEYEADNYGFVQDRKAMRYFKVDKILDERTWTASGTGGTELYDGNKPNLGLKLDISDNPIDGSLSLLEAKKEFIKQYLSRLKKNGDRVLLDYLLYNFSVKIKPGATDPYEWVRGYFRIEGNGTAIVLQKDGSSNYNKAIVLLASMSTLTNGTTTNIVENIHPVTYMANQIGIDGLSKELVPGDNNTNGISISDYDDIIKDIGDHIKIEKKGIDRFFRDDNIFKTIDLNKSYVRLYEPDHQKYGGGHRVKSIKVFDNWENMTKNNTNGYEEEEAEYGTEYFYEKEYLGNIISSGIASYEPLIGGDENPFRQTNQSLVTSNPGLFGRTVLKFEELPNGESFIPGGNVVYSEVRQQSIQKTNVTKNRTGYSKHEFYTAYDYPIVFKQTTPFYANSIQPDPNVDFFNLHSRYALYQTRGYAIYLNDMHGKSKAVSLYAEDKDTPYYYSKSNYAELNAEKILDNEVFTVDETGAIEKNTIGIDVDFVGDTRETRTDANNTSEDMNIDVINFGTPVNALTLPIPAGASPVPFPNFFIFRDNDERIARQYSTTKVVQQYGILKSTETYSEGVLVKSENLLWDKNTGSVVVAKTDNPVDPTQPIVGYTIPAYWHYDGMGFASENIGIEMPISGAIINSDQTNPDFDICHDGNIRAGYEDYFFPGDEVLLKIDMGSSLFQYEKLWVAKGTSTSPVNCSDLILIHEDGTVFDPTDPFGDASSFTALKSIKIIRSGRRNLVGASIGSFTTTDVPTLVAGSNLNLPLNNLLGLSAAEFDEHWQVNGKIYNQSGNGNCLSTNTDDEDCQVSIGSEINPYLHGVLGVWRNKNGYAFRMNRGYSGTPISGGLTEAQIKEDGKFDISTTDLFWNFGSTHVEKQVLTSKWIQSGEVTKISPVGAGLETKDVNDIYQSAQLGYANSVVKASAINAQSREIYFDGFEDKTYLEDLYPTGTYGCDVEQPEYWASGTIFSEEQAHTGTKSLKLTNTNDVTSFTTIMLDDYNPAGPDIVLPYNLNSSEIITGFSPKRLTTQSQKYQMSFWAKSTHDGLSDYEFNTSMIEVLFANCSGSANGLSITEEYESQVIDGWKLIQLSFELPANADLANTLQFQFKNLLDGSLYIDDLRIHPYEAEMNAYVFDMDKARIVAELDAQNFATYYIYGKGGQVVSVRKETEKGIQTLSESRGGIYKKN